MLCICMQDQLFQTLAGILHLGDVNITSDRDKPVIDTAQGSRCVTGVVRTILVLL